MNLSSVRTGAILAIVFKSPVCSAFAAFADAPQTLKRIVDNAFDKNPMIPIAQDIGGWLSDANILTQEVIQALNVGSTSEERRLRLSQEENVPIASSFVPNKYNPHPLLSNPHLQTILGVFIRDSTGCAYISEKAQNLWEELKPVGAAILEKWPQITGKEMSSEIECDYWDERERFNTPDDGFFHVDYKFPNKKDSADTINGGGESDGLVVIIHGLESNSNSSVSVNMARAFAEKNMDVACINFRGCCGTPNDNILQYHGGFTDDLIHFLNEHTDRQKQEKKKKKPIYITGFSLGANIALKCLGDLSMNAIDKYNIQGAAVSGAPFNIGFHERQLVDYPIQRFIYAESLRKSMQSKLDFLVDTFCGGDRDTDVFDYWKCRNAATIGEIEDGMIAPLYGFKDRYDYYEKSASLPVMDKIAVPTYVLNAKDDPFFDPSRFPWKICCERGGLAPIKLERTAEGGHLGHMFHRRSNDVNQTLETPVSSFMPMELARFIEHVHNTPKTRVSAVGSFFKQLKDIMFISPSESKAPELEKTTSPWYTELENFRKNLMKRHKDTPSISTVALDQTGEEIEGSQGSKSRSFFSQRKENGLSSTFVLAPPRTEESKKDRYYELDNLSSRLRKKGHLGTIALEPPEIEMEKNARYFETSSFFSPFRKNGRSSTSALKGSAKGES